MRGAARQECVYPFVLLGLLLCGPSAFAHADGSHHLLPVVPRPARDAHDLLPFVAAGVVVVLAMACVLLRRRTPPLVLGVGVGGFVAYRRSRRG